jgi:hypothetical protein
MNAISPIVDEFNDLEQKIMDIEKTKIVEVYNSIFLIFIFFVCVGISSLIDFHSVVTVEIGDC